MERGNAEAQSIIQQTLAKFRRQLLGLLCCRLLMFSCQIIGFWYFSLFMHQYLVVQATIKQQATINWQFALAAIGWIVSRQLAVKIQFSLASRVESGLQAQIHKQWQQRQMALINQHSVFFWQQLMMTHIPAIAQFVSQYQVQKWLSALMPMAVVVIILPVNSIVGFTLLLTLPIVPLFMILVGKGSARLHRQHFLALERLGSQFADRLKGLKLITIFNRHQSEQQRLQRASDGVNQRTMSVVTLAFLSNTVLDFFSTVSMALVAVFIGFSLLGEIQLGSDLSFQQGLFLLLIAPLLFAELKTLGRFYHQKANAQAAAELLDKVIEPVNQHLTASPFKGLNWGYFCTNNQLVKAKQLTLQPGQHIWLKGPSGAGKTVFLQALMGLHQASHRLVCNPVMLSQDPVILPGSLRDNLALRHQLSDERMWQILQQVELQGWCERLPLGLDTEMTEHPPLSGGEAQRLSLARALLRDTDVMLLDEPTAHLTEQQHQQLSTLIHRLMFNKTVIWASHKSLPEDWFDQYWQMDNGILQCD